MIHRTHWQNTQQHLIYTGMQTNPHITRVKHAGWHTRFIVNSITQEVYTKTLSAVSVFTSLELNSWSDLPSLKWAYKQRKKKEENRKITDRCTDIWHRFLEHREHQYHNQSFKSSKKYNFWWIALTVKSLTDSEILQTASKASSSLVLMLNFDVKCPMSIF